MAVRAHEIKLIFTILNSGTAVYRQFIERQKGIFCTRALARAQVVSMEDPRRLILCALPAFTSATNAR